MFFKLPFYNKKIKVGDLPECFFVGGAKRKLLKFLQDYFENDNILLLKSGRQGIKTVLESLDLKEGDEVIIPSFICPAVIDAVKRAGGKPIFSEIERQGFNMDAEAARKAISSRTRAIILPYIFGIPADLEKFVKLAKDHNITLIEDCAHALGAKYQGKLVGTFADFAIFTFGFSKNVGGVGGGFILSKNSSDMEMIKNNVFKEKKARFSFKQYLELIFVPFVFNKYLYFLFAGLVERYGKLRQKAENEHEFNGFLSDLEARVALRKLRRYEKDREKRNSVASVYQKNLGGIFSFPEIVPGAEPAYLSFPVFAQNDVFGILKKNNFPVERVEFGKPEERLPDNYFLLSLDYSIRDVERICRSIKKKLNKQ